MFSGILCICIAFVFWKTVNKIQHNNKFFLFSLAICIICAVTNIFEKDCIFLQGQNVLWNIEYETAAK